MKKLSLILLFSLGAFSAFAQQRITLDLQQKMCIRDSDSAYGKVDERAFLDLCEFAENVIKRRIEQLAEVAMVDVTGLVERQLQIVPDPGKLAVLGLSIEDIENVLAQNNVEPGSMTVRDGYYEYNIKFSTRCV